MKETEFKIEIERMEGYDFRVSFKEGMDPLLMSEPEPLGTGAHPHGGHLLAAALGHCMCSALLFCLERARVGTDRLSAEVLTQVERNEEGRLRVTRIRAILHPRVEDAAKASRCLEVFEDYCIITQSIRKGIVVEAEVIPYGR